MKHLFSLLLVVTAVPALAGKTVAIAPPDLAEVETLEEVIVAGDRSSLSSARKAIDDAEDRLYARFNELNDVDAFDIVCRVEASTGTLIKKRACEAEGLGEWMSMEVATVLFSAGGMVPASTTGAMRELFMAESKKRMLQLLRKDAGLKRALLERARLEKHYEDLRKEKFAGHWIVWD